MPANPYSSGSLQGKQKGSFKMPRESPSIAGSQANSKHCYILVAIDQIKRCHFRSNAASMWHAHAMRPRGKLDSLACSIAIPARLPGVMELHSYVLHLYSSALLLDTTTPPTFAFGPTVVTAVFSIPHHEVITSHSFLCWILGDDSSTIMSRAGIGLVAPVACFKWNATCQSPSALWRLGQARPKFCARLRAQSLARDDRYRMPVETFGRGQRYFSRTAHLPATGQDNLGASLQ